MISSHTFVILCGFLLLFLICGVTMGYESPTCEYGSFDAWISFDGVNWLNTTYDQAILKRGQPFYVKTVIKTNIKDILVSMNFFEVGVQSSSLATFEIIDGYITGIIDQGMSQTYSFGIIDEPSKYEKIWKIKVRETAVWYNATTPLNCIVFFDKKRDNELYCWNEKEISFTLINAFIQKDMYQENLVSVHQDVSDRKLELPQVHLLLFFIVSCMMISFYRNKKVF